MSIHNPPAFPGPHRPTGGHRNSEEGMTLRDYFAAAIMGGIYASGQAMMNSGIDAGNAYIAADSMLRARSKK